MSIENDQPISSIKALVDAQNFAQAVIAAYYGKPGYGKIYVTGHSLGGIEAEVEAKAYPNKIAGGATFGATGLPRNMAQGGPESLINYVDYGDPIGNYASDTATAISEVTVGTMYHYGQVQMVGSQSNAENLQSAVKTKESLLNLTPAPNAAINGLKADYLNAVAYYFRQGFQYISKPWERRIVSDNI